MRAPMTSKIPGLVNIEVTVDNQVVFEIEDGKLEEFFGAFDLDVGDVYGLTSTVTEALELYLASIRSPDGAP